MLLWILIALLTAAAILAVALPLVRTPRAAEPAAHARRVYRDQLDELERDRADGRLGATEAEAARAEIARRLIALEGEAPADAASGGSRITRRAVATLAVVGVPVLSLSLYLMLGAPLLPGAPLAARLEAPASSDDITTLIAKVEQHLAQDPESGQGWEVIAPVYLRIGRAEDAVNAYRNAIRLLGSTAERETRLGEAIWTAEGGIVTADARAAFEAANTADPNAPGPRFFLALAAKQEGNKDDARQRLTALLADTPADAPWRETVEAALAGLEGKAAPPPGPNAEDVVAAETVSPDEQKEMIEGMVSGLAARLEANPDDADGWLRLIRSYVVLGRIDAAAEAARAALAGVSDAAARERVAALIENLGVKPAKAVTP
ncbi:MAG: c-type cytochrome biogenesis protein CcmI [Propylenella sp.]